ncbi:MAG: hypothetical protein ACTH6O_19455, partial [Vibrio toranzoniae]
MSSQWKLDDPLNQSKLNLHFQKWVRFIIRFRYWVILATVLLVVGLFTRLETLEFDNSNESFLPVNSSLISDMERFKATFGNEDTLVFAMPLSQAAPEKTISQLNQLTHDLETSVPYVRAATGFAQIKSLYSDLVEKNFTGNVSFYWGLRTSQDVFAKEWLEEAHKYSPFSLDVIVNEADNQLHGRTGWLYEAILEDHPDLSKSTAFISGCT